MGRILVPSLFLAGALGLSAQSHSGSRPSTSHTTVPTGPPDVSTRPLLISGKVTVDDGTMLTEPVPIQSTCKYPCRSVYGQQGSCQL